MSADLRHATGSSGESARLGSNFDSNRQLAFRHHRCSTELLPADPRPTDAREPTIRFFSDHTYMIQIVGSVSTSAISAVSTDGLF